MPFARLLPTCSKLALYLAALAWLACAGHAAAGEDIYYVSPDGDIFMETYDPSNDEPPVADRSRQAQIACLILGSRTLPNLAQLLPIRSPEAPTCDTCKGVGWLHQGAGREGRA